MKFVVKYSVGNLPAYGEWTGTMWVAQPTIDLATHFDNRLVALEFAARLDIAHKPEVIEYEPAGATQQPDARDGTATPGSNQPPEAAGGSHSPPGG